MARNTDIETGTGLDAGLIQLTLLSPKETAGEIRQALLTARGKDHDMSVEQLEKLGKACLKYAEHIRKGT